MVASPGVAGQEGETAASWAVDIDAGWKRNKAVGADIRLPRATTHCEASTTPAATAARHSNHPKVSPSPPARQLLPAAP